MQKRAIHLQPSERDQLIALVSKGHNQAHVIKRAYMLLHSDKGLKDETIAQLLFCSEDSVRRVRIRYLNEGLDAALQDRPRPGRTLALNTQQEAYLIALACSEPPAGQEHWTLELLAQRMIDDEQVEKLSPETVRLTLRKNKLKPWRVKSWCITQITPEFLTAMEHLLELYAQPYAKACPVVCFDEKSVELHATLSTGSLDKPGSSLTR